MSKKVAVLLSGCGVMDGSEIHEAVFILLALDQAGASYQCCAPDKLQAEVVNHLKNETVKEQRNVLMEAARIARGKIVPLSDIKASDYDAIMLPGGYGAAKNLCNYASAGAASRVDPEVARVLQEFHAAGKPIGSVCISPVVVAGALAGGNSKVTLTIGNDTGTAEDLAKLGATHKECTVTEFVVDKENKIVTSPAYMYNASPAQVYEGISKAVQAVLELA